MLLLIGNGVRVKYIKCYIEQNRVASLSQSPQHSSFVNHQKLGMRLAFRLLLLADHGLY